MLDILRPWFGRVWNEENRFDEQVNKIALQKKCDDLHHLSVQDRLTNESFDKSLDGPTSSLLRPELSLSRAVRRSSALRSACAAPPVARAEMRLIASLLANAIADSIENKAHAHIIWAEVIEMARQDCLDFGAIMSRWFAGSGQTTILEALLGSKDLYALRLVYRNLAHGSYCDGKVLFDMHGLRMMKDGKACGPGVMVLDEAFFRYSWNDGVAHGKAYFHSNLSYEGGISRAFYCPKKRLLLWQEETYLQ